MNSSRCIILRDGIPVGLYRELGVICLSGTSISALPRPPLLLWDGCRATVFRNRRQAWRAIRAYLRYRRVDESQYSVFTLVE